MYDYNMLRREIPALFAFTMIAVAVTMLLVFFIHENSKFETEMAEINFASSSVRHLQKKASTAKNSAEKTSVVSENSNQIVGNDRDEHGCIGSAGYSWCEEKQKCLRSWEENCGAKNNDFNQSTPVLFNLSPDELRTNAANDLRSGNIDNVLGNFAPSSQTFDVLRQLGQDDLDDLANCIENAVPLREGSNSRSYECQVTGIDNIRFTTEFSITKDETGQWFISSW